MTKVGDTVSSGEGRDKVYGVVTKVESHLVRKSGGGTHLSEQVWVKWGSPAPRELVVNPDALPPEQFR